MCSIRRIGGAAVTSSALTLRTAFRAPFSRRSPRDRVAHLLIGKLLWNTTGVVFLLLVDQKSERGASASVSVEQPGTRIKVGQILCRNTGTDSGRHDDLLAAALSMTSGTLRQGLKIDKIAAVSAVAFMILRSISQRASPSFCTITSRCREVQTCHPTLVLFGVLVLFPECSSSSACSCSSACIPSTSSSSTVSTQSISLTGFMSP